MSEDVEADAAKFDADDIEGTSDAIHCFISLIVQRGCRRNWLIISNKSS